MSYENWIDKYQEELELDFAELKKEEGTEFYEWADYVVDKWTEHNEDYIDDMLNLGIDYDKGDDMY